jgi:hypothetical protein
MPRTTHRDRFSDKEPSPRGLASCEVNAGAAVSFSPGANYFRGRRHEPDPGGIRACTADSLLAGRDPTAWLGW